MKQTVASLDRVTKHYGGRAVLRDVSVSVERAECLCVVGPNGAGKTTLLRVLVGLIRPDGGSVRVHDRVPPDRRACRDTAFFAGGSTLPDGCRVSQWARLFSAGGTSRTDRRRFRTLSRGQRQRAGLRVALGRVPLRLVVLDEPWDGLDPAGACWLTSTLTRLRQTGTAVIVSSHRLADLADVGTRYVVLHEGTVRDAAVTGGVGDPVWSRLAAVCSRPEGLP